MAPLLNPPRGCRRAWTGTIPSTLVHCSSPSSTSPLQAPPPPDPAAPDVPEAQGPPPPVPPVSGNG
jgi:hypothetical protein